MQKELGLALVLAIASLLPAQGAPGKSNEGEAATTETAILKAAYPRISRPDLYLILLGHTESELSSEQLAARLFGTPPSYLDEFDKRDFQQRTLREAEEVREKMKSRSGMEKFRIGVVNVQIPKRSLSHVLGMKNSPPVRFRQMRGYYEGDSTSKMRLMPYSFETSSFKLSAPFLPCDAAAESHFLGQPGSPVIYSIHPWVKYEISGNLLLTPPKRVLCDVRIDDGKTARRIERARHNRMLAIGATIYARLTGELDGEEHVLAADRVEIDFYQIDTGSYRFLGSATLLSPDDVRPPPELPR